MFFLRNQKLAMIGLTLLIASVGCKSSSSLESHPEYEHVNKEVMTVIQDVRTSSGNELYNNLQRLVAYDMFSVEPVLDELADDPNPRLRGNAMWVLAQIEDPEFPILTRKIEKALKSGLEDGDRLVRYEAATALLTRNDWTVIPVLFEGLDDDASIVRYNCHESLKSVTSKDFGYRVDGPEAQRMAAIERWNAWYEDWGQTAQ